MRVVVISAATVSILTTFGIVISLVIPTIGFFRHVSIGEFLLGTTWTPLFQNPQYGILPLVTGTLVTTAIAMCIALPLGLGSAVYLAEYATPRARGILRPTLEVLAGIPTVVFGFFALNFVTQVILEPLLPGIEPFNALSAGLVMGVMIIPTVASLSEDALSSLPHGLREASYALGSSRRHTAIRILIPAAATGIIASFVLGISRAVGETMVVTMAAGLEPRLSLNPLYGMQTLTSYIATAGSSDPPTGSVEYESIFAVGLLLFAITFVMNALSIRLARRLQRARR